MEAGMQLPARMLRSDASKWLQAGTIEGLWVRPQRREPPLATSILSLIEGRGLEHDCHADPFSPRQVLLASARTYERLALPPATLRETFTVSGALDDYPPGSIVALGPDVLLWLTFRCEPCARLNAHWQGLMRTIGAERGVLGRVLRGGQVRLGQVVRVLPGALPAWSDVWQERVRQVAAAVPASSVVDYAHLARLAGVPLAYCRVFPRVLAGAPSGQSPRAVPSGATVAAPRWSGGSLFPGLTDLAPKCP